MLGEDVRNKRGIIEEAYPLKQGLKPTAESLATKYNEIEEAHPLKQGLKQRRR